MKTLKVKIRDIRFGKGTDTHRLGHLVVMADNKSDAIKICAKELNTIESDFDEPEEYNKGLVFNATRSAWEGYQ